MENISITVEIGQNLAVVLKTLVDKVDQYDLNNDYRGIISEIKDLIVASIHEVIVKQEIK